MFVVVVRRQSMQMRSFGSLGRVSALTLGGGGIGSVWGTSSVPRRARTGGRSWTGGAGCAPHAAIRQLGPGQCADPGRRRHRQRMGNVERAEAVASVRAALDAGISMIDVAPTYGSGGGELGV